MSINAEGQRVRRTNSGVSVDYLYDLSGHAITELNSTGGWNRGEVYAGGMHIATYQNGTTYFTHSDWLGTERVRTSLNGAIYLTWTNLPFGEGSSTPNPDDATTRLRSLRSPRLPTAPSWRLPDTSHRRCSNTTRTFGFRRSAPLSTALSTRRVDSVNLEGLEGSYDTKNDTKNDTKARTEADGCSQVIENMVDLSGIEPLASSLRTRRSPS